MLLVLLGMLRANGELEAELVKEKLPGLR